MNPSAEFIVLTADLIVLKNFSSTIFGISGLYDFTKKKLYIFFLVVEYFILDEA